MQDAHCALRCLTLLVRLTAPELLWRLWPTVLGIGRLIHRLSRDEVKPAATFRFETELLRLLMEAGRVICEWTYNQLEPDDRLQMPHQFFWQGEFYRRHRKSPCRKLSCLFGPIRLSRFCFLPLETAGSCLFPLDRQLGLVAGVATPALADLVGRLSADLTQRHVLEQLRIVNIRWGVSTLRKVQRTLAEALEDFRQPAQVEQVLEWLRQAADSAGTRRFTLSVGRDGIMLPIVKKQKYKEAATATLSVLDRAGKRLGTVYLGQMPESGQEQLSQQLTQLLTDVLRQWLGALPRLSYVTDAGSHPTAYFEQVLQPMLHPRTDERLEWEWTIDYYHACQYVTQLGVAIFGPGRAASAWAAKMRTWLRDKPGGVFRVLRSAGALHTCRGLIGGEESENLYRTAYQYLRERASKMDYVRCRRLKLPIGSGVTEAACKTLFTQRFKQSGMKWTVAGGAPILIFRTILLSGIWTSVRDRWLGSYTKPQPVTPNRSPADSPDFPLKTAI